MILIIAIVIVIILIIAIAIVIILIIEIVIVTVIMEVYNWNKQISSTILLNLLYLNISQFPSQEERYC